MKTPEGYEKDAVCKYLRSIGAWYFRPYMAGFGGGGYPDIVACIRCDFWGIEVKRPGKQPTKLQQKRMLEIECAGGNVAWGTADKIIKTIEDRRSSEFTHKTLSLQLYP